MIITIGVIAYNEKNSLGSLLKDICKQTYDHKKIEVILVDSNSTDNTKVIMETFRKNNAQDFYDVKVLSNPKKTQPCGWNVVLNNYSGDAVVRIDAHASIPSDFIAKNVKTLEDGENICGGFRPNIIDEPTAWKETLLLVETSMFGSSIAPYRRQQGKTYVNSLFHGAYRREVFDKIGFFNEDLTRTEDNEVHYRMKKAGFRICFNPEIISYQHTRNSLKGMIKQKFGNGTTLPAYINHLRIHHACQMLKDYPNYTIQAIATDSGFSTLRNFQRLFKDYTGPTPGEYLRGSNVVYYSKPRAEYAHEDPARQEPDPVLADDQRQMDGYGNSLEQKDHEREITDNGRNAYEH